MIVNFHCPRCGTGQRSQPDPAAAQLLCSECGWAKALPVAGGDASFSPTACVCCGNADLWRQKDFPKWLGLVCVGAAAVLSSIAWYYYYPVAALSILMAFALADMVLYMVMGDVLVCYRCGARHQALNADAHVGYNHELGERYRQERLRLEAEHSRRGQGASGSSPDEGSPATLKRN